MKTKHKLKITIHPLFFVLGIILTMLGNASMFFICTISAFFHELGHSVVASKYGYKMNRIRLMPFGAELSGETDCFDGKDEIYISLAGPIVNFFICLLILGLWWINPELYGITCQIFDSNLVMGIFNILPFFPLDGGRILLSVLSQHTTRRESAKVVKNITKVFALTLFMLFLITLFGKVNLTLGIMAFFLFFTATSSAKDAVYQKISLEKLIQSRGVQWFFLSVPQNFKVFELKKFHIKNRVAVFIVIDYYGKEMFRFSELELEKISSRISQVSELAELKRFLNN